MVHHSVLKEIKVNESFLSPENSGNSPRSEIGLKLFMQLTTFFKKLKNNCFQEHKVALFIHWYRSLRRN